MSYAYPRSESIPVGCPVVAVPASASHVYATIAASRASVPYTGFHSLHLGGSVRPHQGMLGTWSGQSKISGVPVVQAAHLLNNGRGVPTTSLQYRGSVNSSSVRAWVPQCTPISESGVKLPTPVSHALLCLDKSFQEDLSASVGSMDTTLGTEAKASSCSDNSINGDEFDLLSHTSVSITSAYPSPIAQCPEADLYNTDMCLVALDLLHQCASELPKSPRLNRDEYFESASLTEMHPMPKTPDFSSRGDQDSFNSFSRE